MLAVAIRSAQTRRAGGTPSPSVPTRLGRISAPPALDPITDDRPLSRPPQLQREFQAALRLRDFVHELLKGPARTEWQMAPGALDSIFIATFAKGTKTFRAVLLLCDYGYAQQAEMLNRSLFEHTIVSWWLLLCPQDEDELMKTLTDHRAYSRVRYDRALEQHPDLMPDGERESPFTDEYVEQLGKRFRSRGGTWHGKSLAELIKAVEAAADERYKTAFSKLYGFVNTHNNSTLHHTALGITDPVSWDKPDASPTVHVGPGPQWRSVALWAATWIYGLLVLATLRRLSAERADDFSDFLDDVNRGFLVFSRAQVKGVGRNDLCPCASGKKFKHCHEPWVE